CANYRSILETVNGPSKVVLLFHPDRGENKLLGCFEGGWNLDPPTCLQLCPALYETTVTKVRCFDEKNNEVRCDQATSGATAKFECATYYESADRQSARRYCWSGLWNLPPPQCIPGQPIVVNFNFIFNVYKCGDDGRNCMPESERDQLYRKILDEDAIVFPDD
ncbi:hypothetical protein JTB14_013645, partial [Gonioctena quinquepunctata]